MMRRSDDIGASVEITARAELFEPREICRAGFVGGREQQALHPQRLGLAVARDDLAAVERDPVGLGAACGATQKRPGLGADQRATGLGAARLLEPGLLARVQDADRDHVLARAFLDPGAAER